jgi:hypothetical protein
VTTQLVIGFVGGLSIAPVLAWRISRRVIVRFSNNLQTEAIARRLENARAAHDFGRDEESRSGAGPSGDQSSLFPARPGKMTLAHISEENAAKGVDPSQH